MNLKYHKTLSPEKWKTNSFSRQILMIANEINRAGIWTKKNDLVEAMHCYARALELIRLTVEVLEKRKILREILRFRDIVACSYLKPPDIQKNVKMKNVLLAFDPECYRLLNPASNILK
jgi:hypothetical protein